LGERPFLIYLRKALRRKGIYKHPNGEEREKGMMCLFMVKAQNGEVLTCE